MVSVRSPEGRRRLRPRSSNRGTLLRSWVMATCLLLILASGGCSQEASVAGDAAPTQVAEAPPPQGALVVFLGDSLTAGYGLTEEEAFPARLGAALQEGGHPVRVVNAGVSGDTS